MIELISQREDEQNFEARLNALISNRFGQDEDISVSVKKIIDDIRTAKDRDQVVFSYATKYDQEVRAVTVKAFPDEIKAAYQSISPLKLKAIRDAIKGVRAFHLKQKKKAAKLKGKKSILALREVPVESVGIYVPGGRAAYPSTVIMNAIPAQIAGVKKIVMVTPFRPTEEERKKGLKGKGNPYVLVAANEVALSGNVPIEIYKIGGAHAVAALAFGSQSIPKVDLIIGPGSAFVTEAKKQLSGIVGIDKLAGPSDVVVLADKTANPISVAVDMKSQMEHDPNASAILVTPDRALADKVMEDLPSVTSLSKIFVVKDMAEGIRVVNRLAPEHLEVIIKNPTGILDKIVNAGAIFLGEYTPVAMGDYGVGPNHVLPTGGTARFSSVLTVSDFMKRQSVMMLTKEQFKKKAFMVETFANMEGFAAHANSVAIRAKD